MSDTLNKHTKKLQINKVFASDHHINYSQTIKKEASKSNMSISKTNEDASYH